MRRIIVTSALPYANGSIHLGHLVEYLQTDIWVRSQKMAGNDCVYICADDSHGTPIMLKAKELGITPETLIKNTYEEHVKDFKDFQIEFDNFHTTHSDENREISEKIYLALKDKGDIASKEIEQYYDDEAKMFLPDRFIKGECPKCGAKDQYGDSCEECGATYSSSEIKNPISTVSNTKPITKATEHVFFKLSSYQDFLKKWMNENNIQKEIKNKLSEWLSGELVDWDITRDKPYFGFEIPGLKDKFFYVWLDAPIGYIASHKNYCDKNNQNYLDDWSEGSKTELYHFIGKDIAYFHGLFWPAMLEGAGFRKPDGVFCHGFLTIDGEKMSKSRGTFFNARTYLNHLQPDYLRYYFSSRLTNKIEDIDLNFDDFMARVNSDLVGKIINIGSRCAKFINKDFGNELSKTVDNKNLIESALSKKAEIIDNYEARNYAANMRIISSISDEVNKYLDEEKPWIKIKDESTKEQVQNICSDGVNVFKIIIGYLKPVLPEIAAKVEAILDSKPITWNNIGNCLEGHKINAFEPLITRINKESIEKMKDENKVEDVIEKEGDKITIDDFIKVDLRVAKVINAKELEDSRKLLELEVDLGDETRTIFAGIKKSYTPEQLIGKLVVVIANLKPRKMKFGVSNGMVLATQHDGDIIILQPEKDVAPGSKIS
jgi:methionyl-tRNA synthetase